MVDRGWVGGDDTSNGNGIWVIFDKQPECPVVFTQMKSNVVQRKIDGHPTRVFCLHH